MSDEAVETFCKNALNILNVSTRAVSDELSLAPGGGCEAVTTALAEDLYDDPLQVETVSLRDCICACTLHYVCIAMILT